MYLMIGIAIGIPANVGSGGTAPKEAAQVLPVISMQKESGCMIRDMIILKALGPS